MSLIILYNYKIRIEKRIAIIIENTYDWTWFLKRITKPVQFTGLCYTINFCRIKRDSIDDKFLCCRHLGFIDYVHLVCLGCRKVVDILQNPPCVELSAEEARGYEIERCDVVFYGRCPECQRGDRG